MAISERENEMDYLRRAARYLGIWQTEGRCLKTFHALRQIQGTQGPPTAQRHLRTFPGTFFWHLSTPAGAASIKTLGRIILWKVPVASHCSAIL
jgi:hypothetical protein